MKKMQAIRKNKGLTQKQLASAANIPVRTLEQYESGARNIDCANIDYLCNIAIALDAYLYEIVEDEGLVQKLKLIHKMFT